MSNREQSISVIICAYTEDRWTALCAAMNSVQSQTRPASELILVIDHNPALLARSITNLAGPGVKIIKNQRKRGLSGARNSGIAASQGDIIAFLDDDAEAEPDWLEQLQASYADSRIFGVGGKIEPAWQGVHPGWFPEEFYWVVGCTYRGMPDESGPVRNLIGANMSFRREVFETVGGFREDVGRVGTRPLGCEETELCIRVYQNWADKFLLYNPRALVHHKVPASRTSRRYFAARCFSEGQSKALISQSVGAKDGLASEWSYTLQTLPKGVLRGLGRGLVKGDLNGFARAGYIMAGLTITTAGYVSGKLSRKQKTANREQPPKLPKAMTLAKRVRSGVGTGFSL
jgi:GT2 family glycosyltransferase